MNYLSLCSGIEAATVAWHPLGWEAVAYSEIEKFPCEVLKHHYLQTPNYGDMTKFKEWPYDSNVDVLVGGTPCQSFSVAGLRKGLDDPRGNLMLTYLAIAEKYRPNWILWENVPGVLSSNGGKDFGALLGGLAELGYGFAYRVLDAQYFGVPQRRRRVFVVGCLGSWQRAAAVLFEQESLSGNPAPSRGKGKETAGTLTRGFGDRGLDLDQIAGGGYSLQPQVASGKDVAKCLTAKSNMRNNGSDEDYVTYGIPGNWIGRSPENGGNATEPMHDVAPCQTKTDVHAVAHAFKVRGGCEGGGKGYLGQDECAFTLSTNQDQQIFNRMAVRRLTPTECERLQGFPDGYTKISDKTADGPRYKALGNSMAVPVMKWLAERIEMASDINA